MWAASSGSARCMRLFCRASRLGDLFKIFESRIRAVDDRDTIDLRDEPDRTARVLIERWLPQFYRDEHGRDVFEIVVPRRP